MKKILLLACILAGTGCARLDHFQIGDIDQTSGNTKTISVLLSDTGFDAAGTVELASSLTASDSASEDLDNLATLLILFNQGPTTGNPTYNDRYAEAALQDLYDQCPSGKITAIRSVRESASYGTVSGEIVRIDADCII